jgi:hypothetical protein
LTTLFGTTAVPPVTIVAPAAAAPPPAKAASKNSWLPLLTVLFLISYGLMTMLIVEQGSTIETQRALIRDLFRDSVELSALKGKAVRERNQAQHHAPAPSARNPVTQDPAVQTPSTQTPSTQTQSSQTPSTQAGTHHRAQAHGKSQKQVQVPTRPASDLADDRRALITI